MWNRTSVVFHYIITFNWNWIHYEICFWLIWGLYLPDWCYHKTQNLIMVSLYWVKEYLDVWAKYINWIAGLQPTTTVCIALKSVCYEFCQLNMACLRILLLLLLSRYYSTVCMRHDCVDWLSTKWGKLLSFNIEVTYPSMVMSDITMSIFVELKIT